MDAGGTSNYLKKYTAIVLAVLAALVMNSPKGILACYAFLYVTYRSIKYLLSTSQPLSNLDQQQLSELTSIYQRIAIRCCELIKKRSLTIAAQFLHETTNGKTPKEMEEMAYEIYKLYHQGKFAAEQETEDKERQELETYCRV
jgi:hypothetical protein